LRQVSQSVASKQLLTIDGAQLSGFHRPPTVEQRFELTSGKQVPIAPGISQKPQPPVALQSVQLLIVKQDWADT